MTRADNIAQQNATRIKHEATRLGFLFCGISKADFLAPEAPRLEKWLRESRHGQMGYMANHFDKRLDPRLLVDGAKSVVTLLYNYYPPEGQKEPSAPRISKYAFGEDYHFVLRDKLTELMAFITSEIGEVGGRVFVDSAPVMDKAWAVRSGAGWMGKNTNIIRPRVGSFFFVAELIIDLDLATDGPMTDHCGTCTACIDACPTEAIYEPYKVDGSRCISYLTIELKEAIPTQFASKMNEWAFGCDICQDVCPWNRFSKPHTEPRFGPNAELIALDREGWMEMTEEVFRALFRLSAVKRTKFSGLKRNLEFLKNHG